ncbi:MAG: 23S rRNA (pseudouridine(1915)-N(3))-methyltransferase RlmH [bacterium]|nr:23S rRNA (pseudouridine(1915)-N(3))-methyltransferase RlmH [bacterium]
MLKVRIVAVGKDKDPWISEGSKHYTKLLSRYASVETKMIPALKAASSLSPAEIKSREAVLIEKELGRGYLIALGDRGSSFDSPKLAARLEKLQAQSGTLVFLIGGAYGLDESIITRADLVLSLSPLTFSHQLVRLILLEQLFRALSILHGSSYHK